LASPIAEPRGRYASLDPDRLKALTVQAFTQT
jgi:hypothetical protein